MIGFEMENGVLTKYVGYEENVVIPEGVRAIGDCAFANCDFLNTVTLSESVRVIRRAAFYSCHSLTAIHIPAGVTSIDQSAFARCSKLWISVDENNQHYCGEDGVVFSKDKTELVCYSDGGKRKTYTIPKGVTYIGGHSFEFSRPLTSVTIPEGVTSIGGAAFYDCYSLTSITIPEGVKRIGGQAFSDCTSLTSVTIPKSVTSIEISAFEGCRSLTIHAPACSYAATYAKERKIPFRATGGGTSTAADTMAEKLAKLTPEELQRVSDMIDDMIKKKWA